MLVGSLSKEVTRGYDLFHAFQLLVSGHAQVNTQCASTDRLIKRAERVVANEYHTTMELEGGRQIVAALFRVPRDNALAVRIQRSLQQIDSHRILHDAVAIVEHDDAVVVLIKRAVQSHRRAVALDHSKYLGRRSVLSLWIGGANQTEVAQGLGHSKRFTDTTFASDDGGRRFTSRDHRGQCFYKSKAVGDGELQATVLFFLFHLDQTREVGLEKALGACKALGLGDHLTISHGDILPALAVEFH